MKTFTNCILKLCLFTVVTCILSLTGASAQKKAVVSLGNPVAYINLMLPSADSLLLVDGTGALFNNKYSAAVDGYDAGKLSNFNENICLMRDGYKLAIEVRPLPKQSDTLFLHMWGMRNQTYDLQINFKSILAMFPVHAFLIDTYLHTQTPVDLFGNTLYSFTPNIADANSYSNRFQLVFVRNMVQQNSDVGGVGTAKQLSEAGVSVYPNPVTGSQVTLRFNNMPADEYTLKLNSLSGSTFSVKNIKYDGGNGEYYLPVNTVIKGVYSITISGKNSGKIIHLPIIVN